MSISIQKRGRRWTANVRLNGHSVSGTFDLKDQAKRWAEGTRRSILDAVADGTPFDPATVKIRRRKPGPPGDLLRSKGPTQDEIDADPAPRPDWTVRQAFETYDDTVTDTLKGARQARARIRAWQAHPLAAKRLDALTPDDVAAFVAARTKERKIKDGGKVVRVEQHPVAASTTRNDCYRLSALYEHARAPVTKGGWGLDGIKNPVAAVALPALPAGRQRRLNTDGAEGEEARVLAALATGPDGTEMVAFVILALETAMRRSELLSLTAREVRSTKMGRVIERADSKNGSARRVILTERATVAIDQVRAGKKGVDRLFTLNAEAVRYRWNRARKMAGCPDLRLHDVRHEGMSSMADAGLSVGALAAQGGYKTMQTLLRYVNASERDIREKLARR